MTKTVQAIASFLKTQDTSILLNPDLRATLDFFFGSASFKQLLIAFIEAPAFSSDLSKEFASVKAVAGLSACRSLRSSLNLPLSHFFSLLAQLFSAFDESTSSPTGSQASLQWSDFAAQIRTSDLGKIKLLSYLTTLHPSKDTNTFYRELADRLVEQAPHAIYPTSSYRESSGYVASTADDQTIEAVVSFRTFTSIKIIDHVLSVEQTVLNNLYAPLGRCICLVEENVESFYGEQIEHYFQHHDIALYKLVYRAMEVDKGIATVERMLGDFKRLGVSRNEPVLIIGGGVLTDTGGLACALYHRNTPYVMLSTSIVAGVDAGPSPRTCCDGFGYKNLFGAYHPPILAITDRFFFKTLREGWLRHGIVEIIKMAVVKDAVLFGDLEKAQLQLIETRFGTVNCELEDEINPLSQKILGGALRSYVAAEYNNLYETHQCRPHAYGHTWSPGFEIEAGLLHGHAVAIGMGFGAYLSYRLGWISQETLHRILRLISGFGLSLWHEILSNKETLWMSQQNIFQKRGQNLVAPLPKGEIGQCAYLNELSQQELYAAIDDYQDICANYPRKGHGIEPHCHDVGLENPSTVGFGIERAIAPEQSRDLLSAV